MKPYFRSNDGRFVLYEGDSRSIIPQIVPDKVDMIFADPPYFLSNGGFSVQAGAQVSVNKGDWDRSHGLAADTAFNYQWIKVCREKLKESGTIWICGIFHNIFSVATILSELDFRILNTVIWQKTNPPPNLSCRYFTHSTEMIVWARKSKKVPHCYNYNLMHQIAGNRQMTDVWRMPAIASWEKTCGKHPTQKPLALVVRAILASTKKDELVLDPFSGSSTTGIASQLVERNFVGIEQENRFLEISKKRYHEYSRMHEVWARKIPDLNCLQQI